MTREDFEQYMNRITTSVPNLIQEQIIHERQVEAVQRALERGSDSEFSLELSTGWIHVYLSRVQYWVSVISKNDSSTFDVILRGFLYRLKRSDNALFIKIQNMMQQISN